MWDLEELFQLLSSDGKGSHRLQLERDQTCTWLSSPRRLPCMDGTGAAAQLAARASSRSQTCLLLPHIPREKFLPSLQQETSEIQRHQEAALIS